MEAQTISRPAHLEPSPLGTKEYWDKLYETEISNHTADSSDLGTIWFDDSSAEDKVLAFLHSPHLSLDRERTTFLDIGTGNGHFLFRLREKFPAEEDDDDDEEGKEEDDEEREHVNNDGKHEEKGVQSSANHIVTTGAFKGRIVGTDYSLKSIEFAQRLSASRDPPVHPAIEFVHCDIMALAAVSSTLSPNIEGTANTRPNTSLGNDSGGGSSGVVVVEYSNHPLLLTPPNRTGYDVVLDKGTFDAISLSDQELDDTTGGAGVGGKRLCEGYKARILPLVKEGGIFVITSCNWTEAELREWFEGGAGAADSADSAGTECIEGERTRKAEGDVEDIEMGFVFVFETALKYMSFRFGGREGQSISSVCFRKRRFGS